MPSSRSSIDSADFEHIASDMSSTATSPRPLSPSLPPDGNNILDHATPSVANSRGEAPPVKHDRFYYEDGTITFVVDGLSYQLHRYLFRESPIVAGDSANITLQDVQCREFDAFLSILYPSSYVKHDLVTVEEWTAVLRLASMWGFKTIRELAVDRLEPIASAVDKIVLAHEYDLDDWLVPAYVELCQKPSPSITAEEGRRLGVDDVMLIFNMRESTRSGVSLFSEEEITERLTTLIRPPPPPPPPRAPSPPPRPKTPPPVKTPVVSPAPIVSPVPGFLFSREEVDRRRTSDGPSHSSAPLPAPAPNLPAPNMPASYGPSPGFPSIFGAKKANVGVASRMR